MWHRKSMSRCKTIHLVPEDKKCYFDSHSNLHFFIKLWHSKCMHGCIHKHFTKLKKFLKNIVSEELTCAVYWLRFSQQFENAKRLSDVRCGLKAVEIHSSFPIDWLLTVVCRLLYRPLPLQHIIIGYYPRLEKRDLDLMEKACNNIVCYLSVRLSMLSM